MLFLRELKKVVYSVTFLILIAAICIMASSQDILDFKNEKLEMPKQGEQYGTVAKDIPEIIMPSALDSLFAEFCNNSYIAYPIGFYKNVKLNADKQQQMAEIIASLTGEPIDELIKASGGTSPQDGTKYSFGDGGNLTVQGGASISDQKDGNISITIPEEKSGKQSVISSVALKDDISYEAFKGYMKEADKLIGGGSQYSETSLIRFGKVPITYEEAMEQYKLTINTDYFTGAYARMFSDYLCAGVLAVLPVFLAVALCMKDKRSKMDQLIYTRKASSLKIILMRYLSILVAVMLPTIILSYISNASVWGLYEGMKLDYLAPLKYDMGWILPSVMISVAVGMFFTELTDTPIAIAIQGLWWFVDLNMGIAEMEGGFSLLRMIPRHNSLKSTQLFIDGFHDLVANRLLFAGMSLILIAATVAIFEQKRRGKLNGYNKIKSLFANRKNQPAA